MGAHLVNSAIGTGIEITHWRERESEVDFVLRKGRSVKAIEVKTGRRRDTLRGMGAFDRAFRPKRKLLVGADGIPLEEFFSRPAEYWIS